MSTTFRYERKIAKRNHKVRCEMTGVPIQKGDRFLEYSGIYEGEFSYIKAHSVIQDMAHESMERNGENSWNPQEACDYLLEWLRNHLHKPTWDTEARNGWGEAIDHPEVKACLEAARAYWNSFLAKNENTDAIATLDRSL